MSSLNDGAPLPKTRKPSDSAFKQQRLPAWQPILTAGTVLPTFFVIGIAFIPVGIGLLHFSHMVNEHPVDYTACTMNKTNSTGSYVTSCSEVVSKDNRNLSNPCICNVTFTLDTEFFGKVFMYYGLTNFYQNHRRYVKSRDDNQLLGRLSEEPSTDCGTFREAENSTAENKIFIAPCGAIANSLFNDKLTLLYEQKPNEYVSVGLVKTGIAWPSDKKIKFRNPPGDLETEFKKFAKPKNWLKNIWELDPDDPNNNAFQNEDLIVWMRTAALPTFRKLYRKINHEQQGFEKGLPKGNYILTVEYNYYVSGFEGTKKMILSTTTLLGGKNPFLGIAYIVVGCMCLVLGIALLVIHIKCSKSTNEMINVNQNTPYQ